MLLDAAATARHWPKMGLLMLQAVVNEDTSGDAALLRPEVHRLREELAAYRADATLHKVHQRCLPHFMKSSIVSARCKCMCMP